MMEKDFNIETTVLFKKIDGKLFQQARLFVTGINCSDKNLIKLYLYSQKWKKDFELNVSNLVNNNFEIFVPSIEEEATLKAILEIDDLKLEKTLILKPHRKWDIHIQNFTHTDIGYTDLPSRVAKGYGESIDSIINFCEETNSFDSDSRYKWNVETGYWLEQALSGVTPVHLRKVKSLVKDGRIEITPLYVAHTSEFDDEEVLIRSLYFGFSFAKECGVKIESAMSSDITGQPWLLPQILYKSGIKYFSTAVNATMAKALKLPRPFYWKSLDGSKILLLDTDERQAYQEGIMVGLTNSYDLAFKKLPEYLMNLEVEGNFKFDLIALRTPGFPGDNTRPNVKVSYIVREWNKKWEYPKLRISTYTDYFKKFEKKYGKDLETFFGAWPDWWVNYHGAVAFETGINRNTHADLLNLERWSSLLKIYNPKLFNYPENELKEVYQKMMLADEADWSSYLSVAEPDSLQTRGQKAEEAAYVYQAAINTQAELENMKNRLAKITSANTALGIVVANSLSWKRSETVEVQIPKNILNSDKSIKIFDSTTGKESLVQLIEPNLHDRQTGNLRVAFNAENIPALGFKNYDIVLENNPQGSGKQKSNHPLKNNGIVENSFYKVTYDEKSGKIKSIKDKENNYELIDSSSKYAFNELIYETTERKRIVDLSTHEHLRDDIMFLQPHFRKIHDYYDFPARAYKLLYKQTDNKKLIGIREGNNYSEIITSGKGYLCPEIKTHFIIDNNFKKIYVKNYLFKNETLDIEALYYAFPFNVPNPVFKLNCHGGYFEPEKEQLPGSCKDWYCSQKWIDIGNSKVDITWSAFDAPLVQLGGINTGKWLDNIILKNGTIMSFIMNNHWWTNSPASQSGRFWFNYSFTSGKAPFSPILANKFGWDFQTPLVAFFVDFRDNKKGLRQCSFINEIPENISVAGLKESETGKEIVIRFLEFAGKNSTFKFGFNDRKMKEVFLASPVEEIIKPVNITNNFINIYIKPFELLTFKIKL